MIRVAALVVLSGAVALLDASVAIAQPAITVETRPGHVFQPLDYNFTEYRIPVTTGSWAFVAANYGDLPTRFEVKKGDESVWAEQYADWIFLRLTLENATYSFSMSGEGTFALLDPALVDLPSRVGVATVNRSWEGRWGVETFLDNDAWEYYLCLQSDGPIRYDVHGNRFEKIGSGTVDGATKVKVQRSSHGHLFFEAPHERSLFISVSGTDVRCEPGFVGAPTSPPSPQRSVPGPGPLASLVLYLLIVRALFRRVPS